jgi:hypothetical protein
MLQARAFCRAVMHEYERQWVSATTHATRHPLRLKMAALSTWCDQDCSTEEFEQRLAASLASDDVGEALLAQELEPLWRGARVSGHLDIRAR